ncbi:MAG: hypothetical protein H6995_04440 [Pseudomonadales bacterium]|nr:hypothetical protein [Pseudomonadales bacterium]
MIAAQHFAGLVEQVSTPNGAVTWLGLGVKKTLRNTLCSDLLKTGLCKHFADKGVEVTAAGLTTICGFHYPGAYQPVFIEEGVAVVNHGIDKIVKKLFRLLCA